MCRKHCKVQEYYLKVDIGPVFKLNFIIHTKIISTHSLSNLAMITVSMSTEQTLPVFASFFFPSPTPLERLKDPPRLD